MIELVPGPPRDYLRAKTLACKRRILVASPFVNEGFLEIAQGVGEGVSRILITRTDLRYFALGGSSLKSLMELSRAGWVLHSLAGLHAKVYVFDSSSALVTSANATRAGLRQNLECGLAVTAVDIVDKLALMLQDWLAAQEYSTARTLKDLESLSEPVDVIRRSLRELPQPFMPRVPEGELITGQMVVDMPALVKGFRGWKRLALEAVISMTNDTFTLDRIHRVCEPVARAKYPLNMNVRAKVRQQMQVLRDLGLLEFKGRGVYSRTFTC